MNISLDKVLKKNFLLEIYKIPETYFFEEYICFLFKAHYFYLLLF